MKLVMCTAWLVGMLCGREEMCWCSLGDEESRSARVRRRMAAKARGSLEVIGDVGAVGVEEAEGLWCFGQRQ